MAGRKRGQATDRPGETAEAPPKKQRDKTSSHTHLAGGGGETEWDIPNVVCSNLISKEAEGVSTGCRLELVDGVSLQVMLPQRAALTEDVHPSHGCESCQFMAQLLQHPDFCVYDSLDGRGAVGGTGTVSGCRLTRSAAKAVSGSGRLRGSLLLR